MSKASSIPGPVRDVVGYNGKPPKVTWPGGARIAISLVVNYEEGSELAVGDGDANPERVLSELAVRPWPAGKRDLAMETMYEYGARVGFWRLMRHLRRARRQEHLLCLRRRPRAQPQGRPRNPRTRPRRGVPRLSLGGRTLLSREQEREHIRLAVESIAETTGERPLGWYCRYGPSVNTRELVVEEGGFLYDSDAYNDDLPYWTTVGGKKHLVIPYSLVNNDSRFGAGHFGPPEDFEEHLRYTFDRSTRKARRQPKMMSIGLHMRLAGHPARSEAVSKFIAYAKSFPDVWFAKRIDIARHWQENHA